MAMMAVRDLVSKERRAMRGREGMGREKGGEMGLARGFRGLRPRSGITRLGGEEWETNTIGIRGLRIGGGSDVDLLQLQRVRIWITDTEMQVEPG